MITPVVSSSPSASHQRWAAWRRRERPDAALRFEPVLRPCIYHDREVFLRAPPPTQETHRGLIGGCELGTPRPGPPAILVGRSSSAPSAGSPSPIRRPRERSGNSPPSTVMPTEANRLRLTRALRGVRLAASTQSAGATAVTARRHGTEIRPPCKTQRTPRVPASVAEWDDGIRIIWHIAGERHTPTRVTNPAGEGHQTVARSPMRQRLGGGIGVVERMPRSAGR